jgi:hypothetical protein
MAARVAAALLSSSGSKYGGVGHSGLPVHLVLHAGFLHPPDTHLTPAGYGHVFDERFFEGGLGLEFFEQNGEEPPESDPWTRL